MIQELLAERKTSIIPNFPCSSQTLNSPNCPPPTTLPTTTSPILPPTSNNATSSTTPKPNGGAQETAGNQQNLRCPRCDSTNTKFCYYNNYNLTQPRHFCKTCRRYWTKGGTLRNVPIGGGCRKNRTTLSGGGSGSTTSGISLISNKSLSSSNTNAAAMAKLAKASLSTEMLLNGTGPGFGLLDHLGPNPYSDLQLGSNHLTHPPIWGSIPQGQSSSHILALLRGANPFTNPNPNPNPNTNPNSNPSSSLSVFNPVKTEVENTSLGLDPYGNGAPTAILGSFLRGNQHQVNGFGSVGVSPHDVQNGGGGSNILELYQRLKSSSNYNYCGDEIPGSLMLGNMMGSSSSSPSPSAMSSPFLESANAGENLSGYNSFMSSPGINGWSEFPTVPINGAFP